MIAIHLAADDRLGIPFIDGDHALLASLINQVVDAVGDPEEAATLVSALNALRDCADLHFAREERLQQLVGYPHHDVHIQAHRAMDSAIVAMRDRYLTHPGNIDRAAAAAELRAWLLDHIRCHDHGYRPFAEALPSAWAAAAGIAFQPDTDQAESGEASGTRESAGNVGGSAPAIEWSRLRILAIDDNRNFLTMLDTLIRSLGVEAIRTARSAEEGLAMLSESPADLLVTDWRLDGMDGLALVQTLRRRGDGIPILMLSGYGDAGFRDRALSAGVDAFLEKPITAQGIVETVIRVMAADHRAVPGPAGA